MLETTTKAQAGRHARKARDLWGRRRARVAAGAAERAVEVAPAPGTSAIVSPQVGAAAGFPPARVVVGTDFSRSGFAAVTLGAALGRTYGAEVHVVVVAPFVGSPKTDGADRAATRLQVRLIRAYRAELAAHLAAVARRPEAIVGHVEVAADAGPGLVACSVQRRADLLVLGAWGHGRPRRQRLGGVAGFALRHASVPILVAHDPQEVVDEAGRFSPRRIGFPTDGSAGPAEVAPFAGAVAEATAAKLVVMHASLPTDDRRLPSGRYLAAFDAAARGPRPDSPVSGVVSGFGPSATVIEALAREHGVGLVILAATGSGDAARPRLGVSAERIIERLSRPVLVVRPPRARA